MITENKIPKAILKNDLLWRLMLSIIIAEKTVIKTIYKGYEKILINWKSISTIE